MRIAVTGATGFVMSNLARHLASAGHDVVALDRHPADDLLRGFLSGLPGTVTFREVDVTDRDAVRQAFAEVAPERVVHGAAITAIPLEAERARFVETSHVNVVGTLHVLEASRHAGAARVVVVSSGSVYGPRADLLPIREDDPKHPRGVYGIAKWAADALARRWAEVNGVDVAVTRLASPFGPLERDTGSRPLLSQIRRWTLAALRGEPVALAGPLEAVRDVVHADDVASGIAAVALAATLPHDAYNVGWGVAATAGQVLQALGDVVPGTKFEHRPEEPSAWGALTRGPLSCDRLQADLGWTPRLGLRSGLREYVSWLRRAAPEAESA